MLDQEKNTTLLTMMEMVETIDNLKDASTDLAQVPFYAMTPEIWALVQEALESNAELLGFFKKQIVETSPLIDNDALMSHITAAHSALQQ